MVNIAPVLTRAIQAVAAIDSVSFGSKEDKSTWRIDFKDEATPAERAAATAVVAAFDIAAEKQKLIDKDDAKAAKKAALKASPNKHLYVQDLIDVGLL